MLPVLMYTKANSTPIKNAKKTGPGARPRIRLLRVLHHRVPERHTRSSLRVLSLLGVLLLSAALTGCGAEEPELILVENSGGKTTSSATEKSGGKTTSSATEKSEGKTDATATTTATTEAAEAEGYTRITMEDAKWYMSERDDFTIVDVRTPSEFREGHIPNAINVPNENIGNTELRQLPDKDRKLLVYCRSGRRSKEAAEKLAKLGYTKVMEFGGIIDWDGEVVTEE